MDEKEGNSIKYDGELYKDKKKIAEVNLFLKECEIHNVDEPGVNESKSKQDDVIVKGVLKFLGIPQELELDSYEFKHPILPLVRYEIKITRRIDNTSYECRKEGKQKLF